MRRLLCAVSLAALGMLGIPAAAAERPTACTGEATAGPDVITCDGSLASGDVIDGGDGDDQIVINGDVVRGAVVRGGAGKDTITAYSVGDIVCPTDGSIGGYSAKGGEVDAGDGDDKIGRAHV